MKRSRGSSAQKFIFRGQHAFRGRDGSPAKNEFLNTRPLITTPRISTSLLLAVLAVTCSGADWPQFRGPGGSSVAVDTKLPIGWDQQRVAWTVDLPGRGPSSPIVVGGRVFLTAASGVRQDRLHVLCYDADSGRRLWERQFWATGRTATHPCISTAAPTPASDGKCVYAFYSSNDLICLDLEGNLRWYRGLGYDYPQAGNDVGMASSPAVAEGVVVVQIESQADSFAVGVDAATGEPRWRVDRSHKAGWSSPVFLPGRGQRPTAVVLQSPDQLTGHEPQTGRQLWRLDAECAGIPSPVVVGDWLFAPLKGFTALRFSETSDAPEIVWEANRLRPGYSSPLVHQGRLYTVSGSIVKCADTATGELRWQLRLPGNHQATPVVVGDHLYCIDEKGEVRVVRLDGQQGEIVGEARFGETIQASPAVSDAALYLRSDRHLWKIR
jgi:outer membrane protein assembly factor BamB